LQALLFQGAEELLDMPALPVPANHELCLNLGDAHSQAARFSVSSVTSTPSLNLIPSMTFGN
jgi:hypothetical protein